MAIPLSAESGSQESTGSHFVSYFYQTNFSINQLHINILQTIPQSDIFGRTIDISVIKIHGTNAAFSTTVMNLVPIA